MDGWMGGWKEAKAGLRLAYSNQKFATNKPKMTQFYKVKLLFEL